MEPQTVKVRDAEVCDWRAEMDDVLATVWSEIFQMCFRDRYLHEAWLSVADWDRYRNSPEHLWLVERSLKGLVRAIDRNGFEPTETLTAALAELMQLWQRHPD